MTLYKKWDTGKSIMFISGIIMLIALFTPWFNMGKWDKNGLGVAQYFFKELKDLKDIFSLFDEDLAKQIDAAHVSYTINNFKWVLLLPIVYPIGCLFRTEHNKSICCLSALATVVLAVVALIFGISYFNAVPWIFIIASVVFFFGTTMASPAFHVEPKLIAKTIPALDVKAVSFCPQCGTQNKSGAKFCSECGTSL